MKRLFVRSGGGMPGLDIHAGIWMALEEAGISATHCAGTSAGAIISGVDAAGHKPDEFLSFLYRLEDDDVRHERFLWKARFAWIDYFMENDRIMRLINDLMPANAGEYKKPLEVIATRASDGAEKRFNTMQAEESDFTKCILASMSICGVFPKVQIGDEEYVDGGVRANLPLPYDWRDYDEIFLLVASGKPESYHKETGLLTNLIKNIGWLMQDQLFDVIQFTELSAKVHLVWPPLNTPKGTLHLDHDLIERAYRWTANKIKGDT